MSVLLKLIYKFNSSPIKTPSFFLVFFFMELDRLILKFIWKNKHARIAKKTLKTINFEGRLDLWDIKTYYKASVIKTMQTYRPMG